MGADRLKLSRDPVILESTSRAPHGPRDGRHNHGSMAMGPDSHSKLAGRTEQPTGDLALLLEAEARFAARLAEARREAERLIAGARAEAEAALAAFNDSQARELRELEQSIREELDARVNRTRQETMQKVSAWLALDEAKLSALAEQVIAPQVVEGLSAPARGTASSEVSS